MKDPHKPYLYYAAPLFNPEDRAKNLRVMNRLELRYNGFLPQRDGVLFADLLAEGVSVEEATRRVIECDEPAIYKCEVLVADLNGVVMDPCTVGEAAFAKALGKMVVGWKTDVRVLLPTGNNPMLSAWFSEIFTSEEELFAWTDQFSADFTTRRV